MKKLTGLVRVVAVLQLVLGILYLIAPGWFLQQMGHTAALADIYYPLGMLASRFIAFGLALWFVASHLNSETYAQYRLWLNTLILIQVIDLLAGAYYTALNVVPLTLSGFPMFNAILIITLLLVWMPKNDSLPTSMNDTAAS